MVRQNKKVSSLLATASTIAIMLGSNSSFATTAIPIDQGEVLTSDKNHWRNDYTLVDGDSIKIEQSQIVVIDNVLNLNDVLVASIGSTLKVTATGAKVANVTKLEGGDSIKLAVGQDVLFQITNDVSADTISGVDLEDNANLIMSGILSGDVKHINTDNEKLNLPTIVATAPLEIRGQVTNVTLDVRADVAVTFPERKAPIMHTLTITSGDTGDEDQVAKGKLILGASNDTHIKQTGTRGLKSITTSADFFLDSSVTTEELNLNGDGLVVQLGGATKTHFTGEIKIGDKKVDGGEGVVITTPYATIIKIDSKGEIIGNITNGANSSITLIRAVLEDDALENTQIIEGDVTIGTINFGGDQFNHNTLTLRGDHALSVRETTGNGRLELKGAATLRGKLGNAKVDDENPQLQPNRIGALTFEMGFTFDNCTLVASSLSGAEGTTITAGGTTVLDVNGAAVTNPIAISEGGKLTLNGGTYQGAINGAAGAAGEKLLLQGNVAIVSVGDTHIINELIIDTGAVVTANADIKATTLSFEYREGQEAGRINLGDHSFTGTIDFKDNSGTMLQIGKDLQSGAIRGEITNAASAKIELLGPAIIDANIPRLCSIALHEYLLSLNGDYTFSVDSTTGTGRISVNGAATLTGSFGKNEEGNHLTEFTISKNTVLENATIVATTFTATPYNQGQQGQGQQGQGQQQVTPTLTIRGNSVLFTNNEVKAPITVDAAARLRLIGGTYSSTLDMEGNENSLDINGTTITEPITNAQHSTIHIIDSATISSPLTVKKIDFEDNKILTVNGADIFQILDGVSGSAKFIFDSENVTLKGKFDTGTLVKSIFSMEFKNDAILDGVQIVSQGIIGQGGKTLTVTSDSSLYIDGEANTSFKINDGVTLTLVLGGYYDAIWANSNGGGAIIVGDGEEREVTIGNALGSEAEHIGSLELLNNSAVYFTANAPHYVNEIKLNANSTLGLRTGTLNAHIDMQNAPGAGIVLSNETSIIGNITNGKSCRITLVEGAESSIQGNVDIGKIETNGSTLTLSRAEEDADPKTYHIVNASGNGTIVIPYAGATLKGGFGDIKGLKAIQIGGDTTLNEASIHAESFTSVEDGQSYKITITESSGLNVTNEVKHNFVVSNEKTLALFHGKYSGTIDGGDDDQGSVMIAGDVRLNGYVGQTHGLNLISLSSDESELTLSRNTNATTIRFNSGGATVNLDNMDFTGEVDFKGNDGVLRLTNSTVSGSITTTNKNTGIVHWLSGDQAAEIGTKKIGDAITTVPLKAVNFGKSEDPINGSGSVCAKNINILGQDYVATGNRIEADTITVSDGAQLVVNTKYLTARQIIGDPEHKGRLVLNENVVGFSATGLQNIYINTENYEIKNNFEAANVEIQHSTSVESGGSLRAQRINISEGKTLSQSADGLFEMTGDNPVINGHHGTLLLRTGRNIAFTIGENDITRLERLVLAGNEANYVLQSQSHHVENLALTERNKLSLGVTTTLHGTAITLENRTELDLSDYILNCRTITSEGTLTVSTNISDDASLGQVHADEAINFRASAENFSLAIDDTSANVLAVNDTIQLFSAPNVQVPEVDIRGTNYRYHLNANGVLTVLGAINEQPNESPSGGSGWVDTDLPSSEKQSGVDSDGQIVNPIQYAQYVSNLIIELDKANSILEDLYKNANFVEGDAKELLLKIASTIENVFEHIFDYERHFVSDSLSAASQTVFSSINSNLNIIASRVSANSFANNYAFNNYGDYAIAAGSPNDWHSSVWVEAFGNTGRQKTKNGQSGYKADSYGGVVGADTYLSDETLIGASTAYSESKVKMRDKNNGDRLSSKTWMFSAYGWHNLTDNLYVAGSATYAQSDVESKVLKPIPGGVNTTSVGAFVSRSYVLDGSLSYIKELSKTLYLTPEVGLRGIINKDSQYTERGGFTNRTIRKNSRLESYQGYLGARLDSYLDHGSYEIIPSLQARITQEFSSKKPLTISQMNGMPAAQTSKYKALNKTFFELGTDIAIRKNYTEYSFGYTATVADKYVGHTGSLKLKIMF